MVYKNQYLGIGLFSIPIFVCSFMVYIRHQGPHDYSGSISQSFFLEFMYNTLFTITVQIIFFSIWIYIFYVSTIIQYIVDLLYNTYYIYMCVCMLLPFYQNPTIFTNGVFNGIHLKLYTILNIKMQILSPLEQTSTLSILYNTYPNILDSLLYSFITFYPDSCQLVTRNLQLLTTQLIACS